MFPGQTKQGWDVLEHLCAYPAPHWVTEVNRTDRDVGAGSLGSSAERIPTGSSVPMPPDQTVMGTLKILIVTLSTLIQIVCPPKGGKCVEGRFTGSKAPSARLAIAS